MSNDPTNRIVDIIKRMAKTGQPMSDSESEELDRIQDRSFDRIDKLIDIAQSAPALFEMHERSRRANDRAELIKELQETRQALSKLSGELSSQLMKVKGLIDYLDRKLERTEDE